MARQVLENGVILPAEYSDDWYDDMTSNLTKLDDVIGSDSEKLSSADVGAAALSNNYNDLDNKPTIPTVNNAALTIQKNGVNVQTFTANASSNVTCNITVPTKTSDLTNDSNFVVSSSLANVATSGDYDDLSNKPSIPTNTSDLNNDSNFVDTSNPAVSSGITSAKVTDYDTHIADTDIHVTTTDKNRWNNQTYVFRYSSTALVASSTNSNTLLDNTDNLKVGDKVIDSSGVLFSITAIDTQNSTFTIGTALVDLAQDSDVVHKSGNETINGELTVNKLISNSIQSATGNIQIQSSGSNRSVAIYNGSSSGDGGGFWAYGKDSFNGSDCRIQIYNTSKSRYERVDLVGSQFLPTPSGEIDCGGTSNKWKTFNGLEPSSLSLPSDRSARIDISSYFTDTSNGGVNRYTAPSNGFVYLAVTDVVTIHLFSQDLGRITNYGDTKGRATAGQLYAFLPVRNGDVFTSQWYTTATNVTLTSAYFIPCQGNV